MVADGTRFRSGVRLAKRYEDVVERFSYLGEHLFGLEAHQVTIGGTAAAEFSSTALSAWLGEVGGMDPKAKNIPACVLRAPVSVRAAFFRGLFEDGTVNVKGTAIDHIEWTNRDADFVHVVQVLLLEFGIISAVNVAKKTPSLYIYSDNVERFRDQIGFVSRAKQERLLGKVSRPTRYRVPINPDDFNWRTSVGMNARSVGYVSRATAEQLGMDVLDFHYVRIERISQSKGPTYCLQIPAGRAFLQNRFDGSNSQGSQWDRVCVIEGDIRNWNVARWRYTAATRAAKQLTYVVEKRKLPWS
jgi:hypothetical protein